MSQTQTYTILNVDDNEAGRYAKSRILQRAHYRVLEAETGAAALRLVKEALPQLVLLDVKLPDFSGLDVCNLIKSDPQCHDTMVLQISAAHVTTEDRVQGLEGGADAYLIEPVEASELVATVRALLRLHSREQENRHLVAELRRSEANLRDFVENATIGLHWVGPDGIILWANKAELQMLGYTPEEYIGRHINEFHADAPVIEDILGRLARGEAVAGYEARMRRKDGMIRDVLIDSSALWEEGRFIHSRCFTRDITERTRAQQEVRHQTQLLQSTMDNAQSMLFMIDPAGRIIFANAAARQLTGYSEEELIGHVLHEKVHHSRHDGSPYPVNECPLNSSLCLSDKLVGHEDEFVRKDGTFFSVRCAASPITQDGTAIGAVVEVQDITREKASEQSLAHLAAIVTSSEDAIMSFSPDLKIVTWNRAAEKLFGWSESEAVGRTAEIFVPPDRIAESARISETLRRGEAIDQLETVRRRKDGSLFDVSLSISPIKIDTRIVGTSVMARDITERKRIEQQREQQARLLDLSLDAISVWGADRGIEYWNEGAAKLYGYSAEEAIGRSMHDLLKTLHPVSLQEIQHKILREGEWEGRLTHTNKHGDPVAVLSRQQRIARPDGGVILEVNRDITILEEAERAVAEAAAHLKAIVETAVDGIVTIDEYGIIASVNPAVEKMFGYTAREVIGRNVSMLMPEPFCSEHDGYLHHYRTTGERKVIGIGREVRGRRKDGSECPIDLGVSETLIGDRRFFTGLLRDATARKQVEQALIEAKEAADGASRAKSEFLANMSHEIRSPMTGVMGYAEILLDRLSDPEDIECARTIKQSGQYLLQIINDILDLAKIEAKGLGFDKEPIHLPGFLSEIYALMEVNAREKALPLILKYDGVIPQKIEIDPKRLRQILINLLSNAIKFTERGSVELVVRFLSAESELQFEVSDSGIGMTREQQRNLFDPFTQGDSSVTKVYGGTGLGLAITHRVVGALGGTIAVDSLAGHGSTFRITLPVQVVSDSPYGLAVAQDNSQAVDRLFADKMSARVLVCEDQPDIRRLMRYFIEKAGGLVTSIENGEAAVEVIKQRPGDFDLILLDIQMPRLDGYEVARRVRRLGFRKPIIAVTAAAMLGERDKCLEAGCDDYLAKPIDIENLLTVIARYTARSATEEASNQPKMRADPLAQAESAPAVDAFDERTSSKNWRILVVDDRSVALNATSRLLEMEGYTVRTASTGHAAIRLAREFEPDLVLLDISLPDISGYEVFRRLRAIESLAKTVFIALSGHGYEEHIRARQAGFDEFLMKPFDIREVDKLIARNLLKGRADQSQ
ncbi:MAG: PAS domain S-box protein [Deltaproteobacteria bacterium]|nr:PAS domain S-box protein [Deltaproteobacteria bacterium]